mgnify:CR=1 FL=1
MSEELAIELIEAVKSSNSFSWEIMINILALVASWITIVFLLKERSENFFHLRITQPLPTVCKCLQYTRYHFFSLSSQ